MGLKTHAGLAAVLAVGVGVSQADKSMNYTPTEAIVTSATVECYVEDSNSKIVEKDTGDLAYMDCAMAPYAAAMHDHDESDIKKRVQFKYAFNSPIDGTRQTGEHTKKGSRAEDYVRGYRFTIHAHKEDPTKRRF